MKALRSALRLTFRFIAGFILVILFYLALAWIFPYIKANSSFVNAAEGVEIYVQSNGVHTDLVLPLRTKHMDWERLFPYSDFTNVYKGFNYVAIGWGDKGFFLDTPTWGDLKFSTAFKAVFGLSTTAMHVTYKYNQPQLNENCRKIILSEKQYRTMIRYILSSFRLKDKMPIHIDHKGYGQQDTFYEANGTYTLFKTCNVWTGNALQVSGVKIGVWTPFDKGIVGHLE